MQGEQTRKQRHRLPSVETLSQASFPSSWGWGRKALHVGGRLQTLLISAQGLAPRSSQQMQLLLLFLVFRGWWCQVGSPCLSGHYLISVSGTESSYLGSQGTPLPPNSFWICLCNSIWPLVWGAACGNMCVACEHNGEGVGDFRDVPCPVKEARWSAGKSGPEKPFPGQCPILSVGFFQSPPAREAGWSQGWM